MLLCKHTAGGATALNEIYTTHLHHSVVMIYSYIMHLAGRVSNRKYESMQNQSTAVFPSRSTIGKIETIPH